ncbi:MAG: ADP-ribosylglycohydrolase family protein [Steroidobacteraceae bacterium]
MFGLVLADSIASSISANVLDRMLDPNTAVALPDILYPDSGMTVAALDSLLARGRHDPADQLQRYLAWSRSVQADARVSMPDAFKKALAASQWSRKTYAGSHDPRNLDAHSISRSLAVALCFPNNGERAVELAADVSRTTQQAPIVLDACRAFAAYVLDALLGSSPDVVATGRGPHVVALTHRAPKPEILEVIERRASYRKRDSSAPAVLDAALQALATTSSFAGGVQTLTASSVPTAVALFGALAGAARGASALPQAWRRSLPRQTALTQLIERLPTV